jgi:hypothetical protein
MELYSVLCISLQNHQMIKAAVKVLFDKWHNIKGQFDILTEGQHIILT